MKQEQRDELLNEKSWLRYFGLSESQIRHLVRHMPYPSAGLFVVGYVDAILDNGRLPAQIAHETIDSKLEPEPPDFTVEEYQNGRRVAKDAPSGMQDN